MLAFLGKLSGTRIVSLANETKLQIIAGNRFNVVSKNEGDGSAQVNVR